MNVIVRTHLVSHDSHDQIIWHYAKNGIYSVKSGHRIAMNNNTNQHIPNFPGNWSAIWKLKLPPRIQLFLWRACMGCIPVHDVLYSRGMQVNSSCPLCNKEPKTVHHALLSSDRIRAYFDSSFVEINLTLSGSFAKALFSSINHRSEEKINAFGTAA